MIYVMSDIHGHYKWFKDMLSLINFNDDDHLYILGDVLDKGEDSVTLLNEVLEDDRMTLLLGNHEWMFLNHNNSMEDYTIWIELNGGDETLIQLRDNKVDIEQLKKEIEKLPIQLFIEVNNQKYCLTHAKPIFKEYVEGKKVLYLEDVDKNDIESAVWSRLFSYISDYHIPMLNNNYLEEGVNLIIGHTPVWSCDYMIPETEEQGNKIAYLYDGRIINIDCGCAHGSMLGCLRLDDMKEFYIEGDN